MELAMNYDMDETIERLNSLLRGELAAREMYRQAAVRSCTDERSYALRALEEEHREAADALREHIAAMGGHPMRDGERPRVWTRAVESFAKWIGVSRAVSALREGEENGIITYEDALHGPDLDPETRALIQSHLLPKAKAHLSVLDEYFEHKK